MAPDYLKDLIKKAKAAKKTSAADPPKPKAAPSSKAKSKPASKAPPAQDIPSSGTGIPAAPSDDERKMESLFGGKGKNAKPSPSKPKSASAPEPAFPGPEDEKEAPKAEAHEPSKAGIISFAKNASGTEPQPQSASQRLSAAQEAEKTRLAKLVEEQEDAERKTPTFEKEMAQKKKTVIAEYGQVKIFKVSGEPLLYYYTPVPRPTAGEKQIINTVKEAATRLVTSAPYRIRDPEQRRNVYYQQVLDILKNAPELNIPNHRYAFYADSVVRDMVGYGLIDHLVNDDKLEEIMVLGPKRPVYVFHREYEMMVTNVEFFSDNEVQDLANRIARQVSRRVDISSPLLDARLADGSRVNATIPPVSVDGSTITIRKFRKDPYTLIDLINYGTLDPESAAFLWMAVEGMEVNPGNILISGGTGSGKTTLLNVLSSMIPTSDRVITIEDTAELSLPLKHWIRLESRPPGLEGRGEVTLDILTKNSLRMRPDRIIVGEIRHAEAFSLFTAMNTGHSGSMGTVHANSAKETLVRVTSPPMEVPELMLSGLDFVIIEHRLHDRKKGTIRRVTEIAEVSGVLEGKAQTQTLFERDPAEDVLKRTEIPSQYLARLSKRTGISRKGIQQELQAREKYLKKIVDKGNMPLDQFSRALEKYLEDKRSG